MTGCFEIHVQPERASAGGPTVTVAGEFDRRSGRVLRDLLLSLARVGDYFISLELGEVAHIDADGVLELVMAHEEQRARRGNLRIVRASPVVRQLLRPRRLDYMLGDRSYLAAS